jgi:hypothetical protein
VPPAYSTATPTVDNGHFSVQGARRFADDRRRSCATPAIAGAILRIEMISHVHISISDFDRAFAFCAAVLGHWASRSS